MLVGQLLLDVGCGQRLELVGGETGMLVRDGKREDRKDECEEVHGFALWLNHRHPDRNCHEDKGKGEEPD